MNRSVQRGGDKWRVAPVIDNHTTVVEIFKESWSIFQHQALLLDGAKMNRPKVTLCCLLLMSAVLFVVDADTFDQHRSAPPP